MTITQTPRMRRAGCGRRTARDRASTVVVLAKEPVPGRVKTRLQATFSPTQSAALAAAALRDTCAAVVAADVAHRMLAWDGDPTGWADGFDVIGQPGGGLGHRLGWVLDHVLSGRPDEPVLLIAMDTPQVTPALLTTSWDGADAVIGLTDDGGYWAIGLRRGPASAVFDGIPMSTDRTGAAQLARLIDLGYRVKVLPPLRDVDTPDDAAWLAESFPQLEFSGLHRRLCRDVQGPASLPTIFDHAYTGAGLTATTVSGSDPLRVSTDLWQRPADAVDQMVIARCRPPVLDVGCGPGRMVAELLAAGRPALGVDISGAAVASSNRRGGLALRRDIHGPIPGEARWGTVLLMDSNTGLGGDVERLLKRCTQLVRPGGLIICEDDAGGGAEVSHDVRLSSGSVMGSVRWSQIGSDALSRLAARINLLVTERWSAEQRSFVALQRL